MSAGVLCNKWLLLKKNITKLKDPCKDDAKSGKMAKISQTRKVHSVEEGYPRVFLADYGIVRS